MNQTLYMNASLKFANLLTEYDQLIWVKLAYYTRDFEVNIESLKSEIDSFRLECPEDISLDEVLKILQESSDITFVDSNKQKRVTLTNGLDTISQDITRLVDEPNYIIKWDNSYKYQSLLVNRYNQSINNYFQQLYSEISKEKPSQKLREISNELFQSLLVHVVQVGDFFMQLWQTEGNKDIDLSLFLSHKPIVNQFDYRYLNELVSVMCVNANNNEIANFTLLFPMIVLLRGYCAFSVLISFVIDAQSSSFADAYLEITRFLLKHFKDSSIYLITRPLSDIKKNVPINNIGSESHTTRLKIFLFDENMVPTLLRFDLPHKGESYLHINVQTPKGKTHLDHFCLKEISQDVDEFFQFIHDQMLRETQYLFKWNDSYNEEDCKILSQMQSFVDYDKQCYGYIIDKFLLHKMSDSEEEKCISQLIDYYDTFKDVVSI